MLDWSCMRMTSTLLWLLPLLVVGNHNHSPYAIVIDGGSTGSRLHVFEFVSNPPNNATYECLRRGSARVDTPLSAFGPLHDDDYVNPQEVALHLMPVFEYAATVIPSRFHATTRVTYQATAGMRLLSNKDQELVYDALYEGLAEQESFVFGMERSDIATLSGNLEGFYGAIAANYLKGMIDANLFTKQPDNVESEQEEQHHGPLGALDMGGSSTQIVFLPRDAPSSCSAEEHDVDTCNAQGGAVQEGVPTRLNGDDFFSTSYLSYGVDQFRIRLWKTWLHDEKRQREQMHPSTCASKVIENPCTFRGYEMDFEGYTLVGTGNTQECVKQVQRLIPHHDQEEMVDETQRKVGGVQHPPLRGKFFAMSLYFFALDSLRELSHPSREAHEALNLSWPNPSIEELFNALDGLCSRQWHGDLKEIQHDAHAYTRAEVLPHRCLESVYMVTLLRDGFGFHPTSRDITFTFLVDGSEVEWSLGMALALYAQELEQSKEGEESTSFASSTEQANVTFEYENEDGLCDSMTCQPQQQQQTLSHAAAIPQVFDSSLV